MFNTLFTANVERSFALDIETMWELWTDPQHLGAWHRPSLEFGPTIATVDLRPGGTYRLEMLDPEGQVQAVGGTYLDIDRPHRLVFTWRWDGSDNDTRVEVRFADADGSTTVTIVHTDFVAQAEADMHAAGWAGCLETLAALYRTP
ncbi:SRPBCC family protein [Microbacterium sp. ASV49]|uniref:SRPBCC domain-containing protein n=1 Tax=Microbacterium candidum TaxID=3041922 RepID=A0ABT7N1A5_9MICO|nr:SRPBCC domain-containing protein [Microbacterium sp. ASV49]MDL9980446.1 SRPBCC domain-containing protein [Microbacterium sp. ASV49]